MLRLLPLLALATLAPVSFAQALVPGSLPVEVRAHASRLDQKGGFHLQLSCFPREAIERDYDVRIAVDAWADEYSLHELSPKPATSRWKFTTGSSAKNSNGRPTSGSSNTFRGQLATDSA